MNNIIKDMNDNISIVQTIDKAVTVNNMTIHDIIKSSSDDILKYIHHIDPISPIHLYDKRPIELDKCSDIESIDVRVINDRNKIYKTFSTIGNLITPRSNGCSSGNSVYSIIGGCVNNVVSDTSEKYQTISNTPIAGPNLNIARMNHGCSGLKESMAIVGGIGKTGSISLPTEKLANDIFSNTSVLLNTPRQMVAVGGLNSTSAHAIGGQDQTTPSDKYELFNGTSFIIKANMNIAKTKLSIAVNTDNTLLSIGGKNDRTLDSCEKYNTVWSYDSQLLVEVDSVSSGGYIKNTSDMTIISGGLSNDRLMVASQLNNGIGWFINSYQSEPRHSSQNSGSYNSAFMFGGDNNNNKLSSIENIIDIEVYANSKRDLISDTHLTLGVIKNDTPLGYDTVDGFMWYMCDNMLGNHSFAGTAGNTIVSGGDEYYFSKEKRNLVWSSAGENVTSIINGASYGGIYTGGQYGKLNTVDLTNNTMMPELLYPTISHSMSGTSDNMTIMGGYTEGKISGRVSRYNGTVWSMRENMPIGIYGAQSTYSEYINNIYSGSSNTMQPSIFSYTGSTWYTSGCVNVRRSEYGTMKHNKGTVLMSGLGGMDNIYSTTRHVTNTAELITNNNAMMIGTVNIARSGTSSVNDLMCGGDIHNPTYVHSRFNCSMSNEYSTEGLIYASTPKPIRELLPYYNSIVKVPLFEIRTNKKIRGAVLKDVINAW